MALTLALQRQAGNAAVARAARDGRLVQRTVHPEYKTHWTSGLELGILRADDVRAARETVVALGPGDARDLQIRSFVADPPEKGALRGLRRLVSGPRPTDHHARAWKALADSGFELTLARARLEADPPRAQPTGAKRQELSDAYTTAILTRLSTTTSQRRAFSAFWAQAQPEVRWQVLTRVVPEVLGTGLKPMTELTYVFESIDPKRRHNGFWQGMSGWLGADWLEYGRPGESLFAYADRLQKNTGADTTERHDKTTRARYRVTVRDGALQDVGGPLGDEEYLFVVDATDALYAAPGRAGQVNRHHSSFLGGRPVKAAGMFATNGGRITWLSQESGHYKPTKEQVLLALRLLQRLGVNLSSFTLKLFQEGKLQDVGPAHMALLTETSAPGRRHRPNRLRSDADAPRPGVQVLTGLGAVGW